MKRLLASVALFAGCAPAVTNPGTEPVYEAPEHASPTPSSIAATQSAQTVEVVAFGPNLYRIADGSTVDAASLNASLKGDELLVVLLPPDVDELAVGGAVCKSACLMPHQRFIVEGVPSKTSPAPSDVPARADDGEPVMFVTFLLRDDGWWETPFEVEVKENPERTRVALATENVAELLPTLRSNGGDVWLVLAAQSDAPKQQVEMLRERADEVGLRVVTPSLPVHPSAVAGFTKVKIGSPTSP